MCKTATWGVSISTWLSSYLIMSHGSPGKYTAQLLDRSICHGPPTTFYSLTPTWETVLVLRSCLVKASESNSDALPFKILFTCIYVATRLIPGGTIEYFGPLSRSSSHSPLPPGIGGCRSGEVRQASCQTDISLQKAFRVVKDVVQPAQARSQL